MIKDYEACRTISLDRETLTLNSSGPIIRLATEQLVESVIKEVESCFPVRVQRSMVAIEQCNETRRDEQVVHLRARIHGDIINCLLDNAAMMASAPMLHIASPHDKIEFIKPHYSHTWDDDESTKLERRQVQILQLMLEEVLPNWREVYDKIASPGSVNWDHTLDAKTYTYADWRELTKNSRLVPLGFAQEYLCDPGTGADSPKKD